MFFFSKQELILHFTFFSIVTEIIIFGIEIYHFSFLILKIYAVLMYNHSSYKPEVEKLGFAVFTVYASKTSLQFKKWRNVTN